MKYIIYATTNNGHGFVSQIGEYEDPEDIAIYCGMFADDVKITIETENCESDCDEENERKDDCEKKAGYDGDMCKL